MTTDHPTYVAVTRYFLYDQIDIDTDLARVPRYDPTIWAVTDQILSTPSWGTDELPEECDMAAVDEETLKDWHEQRDVLARTTAPILQAYETARQAHEEAAEAFKAVIIKTIEDLNLAIGSYEPTATAIQSAVTALYTELQAQQKAEDQRARIAQEEADDRAYGARIFRISASPLSRRMTIETATIHLADCGTAARSIKSGLARPPHVAALINDKRLPFLQLDMDYDRKVEKIKLCGRCKPQGTIDAILPELRSWCEEQENERRHRQPPLPPNAALRTAIGNFQKVLPWRVEGKISGFEIVRPHHTNTAAHELQLTWFDYPAGPEFTPLETVNERLVPWGWIARPVRHTQHDVELSQCFAVRRMTPAERDARP